MTKEKAEVEALGKEYEAYIAGLKRAWLAENRYHSRDVFEVLAPAEQKEVHRRIRQWGVYVTPFAEKWWEQRGYGVRWPLQTSEPMKIFKLESA